MSEDFVRKFKKNQSTREELFNDYEVKTIADAIVKNSKDELGFLIWTSTFQYTSSDLKLYEIIESVLPKLNRDELQLKKLTDYYSRLSIELSREDRSAEFVLNIALLCERYISVADQRAVFWKDVLPVSLTILHKLNSIIEHDGKSETGRKCVQDMIDRVLRNRFPVSAMTAFVSMFKDIELTAKQHDILITKVSENICKVQHQDIGNLAMATFQTALFNQLLIPILALDKYFFKQRYRKEINETASDVDSIDDTPAEGVIETEEIVIYHFQNVAEYTTIERDLTNAIKPLEFTPKFILSPFISTLLVSIAKISSSVEGNFRLNQSTVLPLLKQIFKFNEEHKNILRTSGWASSVDESSEIVNTDMLLKMLQQNTCGLRQNIALNGLFGLSFLLLKTKASPTLNKFAIDFLNEIIKKRQEFTADILRIIIKMLFCEKNKTPIIQCLSTILQNRYLDINATQDAMRKLIEDLTELDIDTALAIESVIFTVISKSIALRDVMIDVMKAAMYQKNMEVRKMAVFSFCVMLRKFTKPPRSSFNSTQQQQQHHNEPRYSHNISFFSLTQSQIALNVNSNMRQVEIMMLEILGMLRKCFSDTREIRVTLYESLLSSIMANTFIASNVLEFIEGHFRDYFDLDDDEEMIINFEKAYKISSSPNSSNNEETIIVMDDLGCLIKFIINCVIIIASSSNNRENINCDLNLYRKVINKLIEKVSTSKLSHLEIENEKLLLKHTVIIPQFLNCIEALMIYCLHESQNKNNDLDYAAKITILFEKHQKVRVVAKKMLDNGKKKSDKKVTMPITKLEINSTCVWDLKECSNFLKLIVDGPGISQGNAAVAAAAESFNALRTDKEFHKFAWEATSLKIQNIQMAREHSKLRHSRVIFDSFLTCSELLFKQLDVERIENVFTNFGVEFIVAIAEGFKNSSQVLESAFYNKREKLNTFLRAMTAKSSSDGDTDTMLKEVLLKLQNVVEWCFEQDKKDGGEFIKSANGNAILCNLFCAIQIFASSFQFVENTHETFNWILNFSKTTSNVKQKNLAACIIKLLLQSLYQHENQSIIDCVSHKIATIYKYRLEINEPESASQNNYTIISKHTVEEAFFEFIDFIKKQITIIDVYIKRVKSFNAHASLKVHDNEASSQESRIDSISSLQNLEMAICTKLISLGKALERISSSNFPLQSSRHVEKLISIIRAYYGSMTNLMKHFRKHHNIKNISNQENDALEALLKYSRKFAKCVYSTVKYIGDDKTSSAITKDNKKTKKSTATGSSIMSKAKKSIPKVIFMLENFHKSVADFDLAAKKDFSRYLHPGEVRDFHIDKNNIGNDVSLINDDTSSSDNEDTSRVASSAPRAKKRPIQTSTLFGNTSSSSSSSSSENEEELHDKEVLLTRKNFEDNLRKISKVAARKKK